MATWFFFLFDLFLGPRVFELFWRIVTSVSPLTPEERGLAIEVLGPTAIHYGSVRIAGGGILKVILKVTGGRAFTTFHTINMPISGPHSRANLPVLVHELVHVRQFEHIGSRYVWEGLCAQRSNHGYDYGGYAGLREGRRHGSHYRDYNREQQGQIAADYCELFMASKAGKEEVRLEAYKPFIEELRSGDL